MTTQLTTNNMIFNPTMIDAMMRLAHEMADCTVTIPKHLSGKPADCLAIVMQSAQWGMSPFSVAQKTYIVNGILGYEAQLVNAVAQSSGAIKGRFHYEYSGEGDRLACRVGAIVNGENEICWGEWLHISQVKTKNSPLWKDNPKQQMGYLQVKNWCRAFCPAAIQGVYTPDELESITGEIKPPEKTVESIIDNIAPPELNEYLDYLPGETLDNVLSKIKAIKNNADKDAVKLLIGELSGDDAKTAKEALRNKIESIRKPSVKQELSVEERLRQCGDKPNLMMVLETLSDLEKLENQDLIDELFDMFR